MQHFVVEGKNVKINPGDIISGRSRGQRLERINAVRFASAQITTLELYLFPSKGPGLTLGNPRGPAPQLWKVAFWSCRTR